MLAIASQISNSFSLSLSQLHFVSLGRSPRRCSHCALTVGVNFSTCRDKIKMPAKEPALWLSRQVSNLNSSDPESDVLPITPRDNFEAANIDKFLKIFLMYKFYNNLIFRYYSEKQKRDQKK